jgi:hypothetical protein
VTASLFKDVARTGWHSSIMTTYSVDPAFYDGSVERRLRDNGCRNNVLMADAVMLKRALSATPEAFRNAGRRYAVVPVQVAGCFHPKLHLRLSTDSARLIVGSANATAAGWGRNQEVLAAMDWSARSETDVAATIGPLIRKSYDYLLSWLADVPGEALEYKRRLHLRDSPWLRDLRPNDAPVSLPDGSAIDLFCEKGGEPQGMMSRLAALVGNDKARRLVVISPYWDSDLAALMELRRMLDDCPAIVVLNPDRNEFPIDVLPVDDTLRFLDIRGEESSDRFVHAKVILVETDAADHVLFGSANCSDDALGSVRRTARNAEVSLYRRFPRGRTLELLELNLDARADISRLDLRRPNPEQRIFESGRSAVLVGAMEVAERILYWWPLTSQGCDGAVILLDDGELATRAAGNGYYVATLPSDPVFPLIVRIRFADGRESDPTIVHDHTSLRRASPGVVSRQLGAAFERVRSGEEDLLDLARQAHLLFKSVEPGAVTHGGDGRRAEPAVTTTGQTYTTPQAFREAVALLPGTGRSGRFSVDEPDFLELLFLIVRRIPGVGEAQGGMPDDDNHRVILAGETEDGVEDSDIEPVTDDDDSPEEGMAGSTPVDEPIFTSNEIARRKRRLHKTMEHFEAMLDYLSGHPAAISDRLTAQTAFMLNLMLFGCKKEHRKADGSIVRLMELAPTTRARDELSFATAAGRILQRIWGGGGHRALADLLKVPAHRASMSDDYFILIVMSRWAIARAYLAVAAVPALGKLSQILLIAAATIYRSTQRFGSIDGEAERRLIEGLESTLGFSPSDTSVLIDQCRTFAARLEAP